MLHKYKMNKFTAISLIILLVFVNDLAFAASLKQLPPLPTYSEVKAIADQSVAQLIIEDGGYKTTNSELVSMPPINLPSLPIAKRIEKVGEVEVSQNIDENQEPVVAKDISADVDIGEIFVDSKHQVLPELPISPDEIIVAQMPDLEGDIEFDEDVIAPVVRAATMSSSSIPVLPVELVKKTLAPIMDRPLVNIDSPKVAASEISSQQQQQLADAGIDLANLNVQKTLNADDITQSIDQQRTKFIKDRVKQEGAAQLLDNNYVVPDFMNKRQYSKQNKHLPPVTYNSDLDNHLVIAAAQGDISNVRTLLNTGIDIDAVNEQGNTALLVSVLNNNIDMVRFLLLRGADINKPNSEGVTALHVAIDNGRNSLFDDLVYKKADIHAMSNNGVTTLMRAVLAKNNRIFDYLLSKGVNANAATFQGVSILHLASKIGNFKMVKSLLAKGVVPNIATQKGVLPEEMALINGFPKVANLIAMSTAEIIRKRQAILQNKERELRRTEEKNKLAVLEQEKEYKQKIAQLIDKPFNPADRYSQLGVDEQKIWDERLRSWSYVDKNISRLSKGEFTQWNNRRKKIESIYGDSIAQKVSEMGGDYQVSTNRWNEINAQFSQSPPMKTDKQNRKAALSILISDWREIDSNFYNYNVDEKISANNKRIALLTKILGDQAEGSLNDVFVELPEDDKNALRSSMAKWDDFERQLKAAQKQQLNDEPKEEKFGYNNNSSISDAIFASIEQQNLDDIAPSTGGGERVGALVVGRSNKPADNSAGNHFFKKFGGLFQAEPAN